MDPNINLNIDLNPKVEQFLGQAFGEAATSVERDLHLNLKKLLAEGTLAADDRFLNFLALSTSIDHEVGQRFATDVLTEMGLAPELILEAKQSAAIMGMLNTYYKFKSYLPAEVSDKYNRAGLRMQSLMKPANGKLKFEMMAFAVSVLNGCPSCIASHEAALTELGLEADKIHDLARMAAVVKGITSIRR